MHKTVILNVVLLVVGLTQAAAAADASTSADTVRQRTAKASQ